MTRYYDLLCLGSLNGGMPSLTNRQINKGKSLKIKGLENKLFFMLIWINLFYI